MNADIVYFILIIVFFVLPILGRIIEVFTGGNNAKNQKRPSREDIREYLERMRAAGQKQTQQTQYQAARTSPSSFLGQEEEEDEAEEPSQPIWKRENKFDRIEKSVQQDIYKHVDQHLNLPEEEKNKVPASGGGLQNLVMANKGYTDIQKAIILTEIFSLPKGLKE